MGKFNFKEIINDSISNVMAITDKKGNSVTFDKRYELYLEEKLKSDVADFFASRSDDFIYVWDIDNSEFKAINPSEIFSLNVDGKFYE